MLAFEIDDTPITIAAFAYQNQTNLNAASDWILIQLVIYRVLL